MKIEILRGKYDEILVGDIIQTDKDNFYLVIFIGGNGEVGLLNLKTSIVARKGNYGTAKDIENAVYDISGERIVQVLRDDKDFKLVIGCFHD